MKRLHLIALSFLLLFAFIVNAEPLPGANGDDIFNSIAEPTLELMPVDNYELNAGDSVYVANDSTVRYGVYDAYFEAKLYVNGTDTSYSPPFSFIGGYDTSHTLWHKATSDSSKIRYKILLQPFVDYSWGTATTVLATDSTGTLAKTQHSISTELAPKYRYIVIGLSATTNKATYVYLYDVWRKRYKGF